jgi:DnaK suppressor protein
MFVSILQLMGFAPAKPVHSPADGKPLPDVASQAHRTRAVKQAKAQAPAQTDQDKSARRSPVKAPAAKTKATAKTAAVSVKSTKAVKPAMAAKPVKAVKSTKPVKEVKPAKTAPQVKAKTPPAKPKVVEPVAVRQAPIKKGKTIALPVSKPVLTAPKKKPQEVTIQTPASPPSVAPATPAKAAVKPVMPTTQMTSSGVPVRTGRPSSRLAQLTVPSMAQTVASTAAKSSFTQMANVIPIVSPLASSVKKDKKLANNWKTKPVEALTNDEVLAMPDDAYMNETQLAFFRLKLVHLKNDILNSAGETTEHLREDTVVVPDPADRATIEEEHALELRTRDRERKLLKKIEQSITRIDAGDYGYCDETGEAIGVGRLLARPTATLSLEAQQRRELKQKMFGD